MTSLSVEKFDYLAVAVDAVAFIEISACNSIRQTLHTHSNKTNVNNNFIVVPGLDHSTSEFSNDAS